MSIIKSGKLNISQLENIIFNNIGSIRKDVVTKPFVGQDCGFFLGNNDIISVTSDPITATSKNIGRLAVIVNINDVATSFAEPIAITVTILAPENTEEEKIKEIMSDISDECTKYNVQIIGGHTEVTSAVNREIVSITAFGRIDKDKYENLGKVKAGQKIYMSKSISLEGSLILLEEKMNELKDILTKEEISTTLSNFEKLSVLKDSQVLRNKNISLLHDVTEGGIFGAIYEMMKYAQKGCKIDVEKINVNNVTKKICDYFNIDIFRLLSSGCLLIITEDELERYIDGIEFTQIGVVTESKDIIYVKDEKFYKIQEPSSDSIYEVI